jgi:hypothetical protein
MKQTSVERIGRSQLIPGVRRTQLHGETADGGRVPQVVVPLLVVLE